MSETIPQVCTGPMNKVDESEEEKLRIRKNCTLPLSPRHCVATTASIPPKSPELVPPCIDNSDEQCKPVSLPRPISL